MIRIGFTGGLAGMTREQGARLIATLETIAGGQNAGEFHYEDLIGAGSQAHRIAAGLKYDIVIHPCTDIRFRAGKAGRRAEFGFTGMAPLVRSKSLVQSVDIIIVAIGWPMNNTARLARTSGKKVLYIGPDGRMFLYQAPDPEAVEIQQRQKFAEYLADE